MTTGVASPVPILQFFNNAGAPNVGGSILTQVGGVNTATYQDIGLTIPLPNPIPINSRGEVSNASGLSCQLFLMPNTVYVFTVFDQNGNQLNQASYVNGVQLTAASVGQLLFPQSAAEVAAGVTPSAYQWPPGDPRRYGATLNGVTDDTAALQSWAQVGGALIFPVAQTAIISASIPLSSNTTISAVDGAMIQTATHDMNMFAASGKNNISVRNLHFKMTSAGTVPNVGGVALINCTDCIIEECEFEGMQFSGVLGSAISRCTIRSNYIHDCLGAMQNSADIYIESSAAAGTSSYNVIEGNFCYGPNFEFGIAVWDPYAGVLPTHNIVTGNRIKAHNGYGILIYMPTAGDSFNQVIGNHVQDISAFAGLPNPNTDSGAGIYLAGQGMGGTQVIGNTVQNCCITTSTASLAPAGIGLNGSVAGSVPVVIQGNTIEGMTKYWGILLTGCLGGASVTGNTIRMPASNTTGDALRVTNSNNVSLANNTITQLNTTSNQEGIMIFAQGLSCIDCAIVGNTVNGGHHSQIRIAQAAGNVVTGLAISANILTGGDASCIPLLLDNTAGADILITGNYARSTTVACVSQTAAINVRYANNFFNSTGTVALAFSGVNTGSYYDKTNIGTGIGAGVNNAGMGLIIEQFGSGSPTAGTWAVGDSIRNSAPSVGGVLEWVCTTAGTGGGTAVFKTISNT